MGDYQQLGDYSDAQGQHYAALYAAQAQAQMNAAQMGVAGMTAYDAAQIAAWQVRHELPRYRCIMFEATVVSRAGSQLSSYMR